MMPAQSQRCSSISIGSRGVGDCGHSRWRGGQEFRSGVLERDLATMGQSPRSVYTELFELR